MMLLDLDPLEIQSVQPVYVMAQQDIYVMNGEVVIVFVFV